MNPVVLIATHNRLEITSKSIENLMMQSVQPKIVLVVSDQKEWDYYAKRFPVELVNAPNNPLGAKWQAGVALAKTLNPNPLIICGSDDILGIDFIENACALIKSGYDFVGLSRWHVYHQGMLYTYDYNASIPLGGGRCYGARALNEIRWKLFDTSKERHLDDDGWKRVNSTILRRIIVRDVEKEGLNIISIKGNWSMMNPFEKFKTSQNVKLISKSRDKSELQNMVNYG